WKPFENEARFFRPLSMNSLPALLTSSNDCIIFVCLALEVAFRASKRCGGSMLQCTICQDQPLAKTYPTSPRKPFDKLERNGERGGYHKRIGNPMSLIVSVGIGCRCRLLHQ